MLAVSWSKLAAIISHLFDRENVAQIAHSLYEVIDLIKAAAGVMLVY